MARLLATLVITTLLAASVVPTTAAQTDTAAQAVFMVVTAERQPNGTWKGVGYGTAFFVSADGRALTNSHVVYQAQHDPDHDQLLAIVGDEFYGASIVCASRLPYDPTKKNPNGITSSRDIAEIQVTAPTVPFKTWGFRFQNQRYEIAHRHEGPLPQFPALQLGRRPGLNNHVTVIGFGHISPIPEKWTASGMVSDDFQLRDGTHAFEITFTSPAQPGNSGSPVLSQNGEVVGVYTWYSHVRSDLGWGQTIDTVTPACR